MTDINAQLTAAQALEDAAAALRTLAAEVTVDPNAPKVGDRVRIVSGFYRGTDSVIVGRVGKLTAIDSERDGKTKFTVDLGDRYEPDKRVASVVEKVTAPVSKAHADQTHPALVGDTIRVVKLDGGILGEVGNEYVVSSVYPTYVVAGGWGVKEYDVVKRADDAVKTADDVKVGDRVRVVEVAPWTEYSDTVKGKTGTVTAVGERVLRSVKGIQVMVDGETSAHTVGKVEVLPEPPADELVIYDGDNFNVSYLTKGSDSYDAVTVDINDIDKVWVTDAKLDELIEYLTAVRDARKNA